MTVWRLIAADVRAWQRMGFGRDDRAGGRVRLRDALTLAWRYAGLRATITYRLSHEANRRRIPALPGMLFRRNIRRYGLDIVPGVPIGPGLYIPHPVGTVIMARAIGCDCQIISAVTIGMRNRYDFPTIGDGVTIGCGARVLGGITIGDGAHIGANAVVIDDVPAGATAVGIPARVVRVAQSAEAAAAAAPAGMGDAGGLAR